MAIVLAATSAFVYVRLGDDLRRDLDQRLRVRTDDVGALVRQPGARLANQTGVGLIEQDESFAQLLAADGTVLDATPLVASAPLLSPGELAAAARGPLFADRARVLDEPARLLATPLADADPAATAGAGGGLVLVVGASSEERREALADLRNALLIAGPIALLLATGIGYRLAGGGLAAVEAMRLRAAEVSAEQPDERLPVPATGDELERLGHTLNGMLDRLQEALEQQRTFVANASHELRTPLALLRAELDFATEHARDEEELRAVIGRVSAETDHLAQLAADLLVLASSDQGQLPLRLERLAADELLESVRNRYLLRARDTRRTIAVAAPAGLELVGDRLRLEQALSNLVDNALRHGEGEIRMEARDGESAVVLAVTTRGPGFPEDYLPRAFDRFTRPEHGRGGSGSGLGLAIVAAIARAHGGEAHATNAPGGGAVVTLAIPEPVAAVPFDPA